MPNMSIPRFSRTPFWTDSRKCPELGLGQGGRSSDDASCLGDDRQKNDVRNGSLDGSPVRGPAGREPILFTLPFESSRLNGRKSRSGKSVPGSGRLRGISRPNTRSFFRPCLQRANGRTRLR